jgi:hypothetical protein
MKTKRRSLDEWAQVVEEMLTSNMSQRQWCDKHDINWNSMHQARNRLKEKATRHTRTKSPQFVRVEKLPCTPDVTFICAGISVTTTPQSAAVILKSLAGDTDA